MMLLAFIMKNFHQLYETPGDLPNSVIELLRPVVVLSNMAFVKSAQPVLPIQSYHLAP